MTSLTSQPGRRMVDGAARMLLAQALVVPTGLLSAALLARWLSPAGYGVLTLAATLVAWVEWCIPSVFARAATRLVAGAEDASAVGSTVLRVYAGLGLAVGLLLLLCAPWLAALFGEPALARVLRLFAADVPLFAAASAHRAVLVGAGRFRAVSLATAAHWLVRLALLAAFVGAGFAVEGAVAALVLTSAVELFVYRRYVRPPLFARRGAAFPARRLFAFALPLFLAAVSLRLFDKLDLFLLKALGGTTAEAGFYGAAQNFSLAPSLFALSFSPALLATLARVRREGDEELARKLARDAMRVALWLTPFAALVSGAAHELVRLVFGAEFAAAAAPLALLIFGAAALVLLSVATAVLVAADRPGLTLALVAPLPALAAVGHLLMIPRLGMKGAALVTLSVAGAGALVSVASVRSRWGVAPPAATLLRCALVAALTYGLAAAWPASGFVLACKLTALALLIPSALLLLGEFSAGEAELARAALRRWLTPSARATAKRTKAI